MRAHRLAWLLFSLPGCFVDCGPGEPPEPEKTCVDDEPAPAEGTSVVIGSAEDGADFAKLSDGAELTLDYGSQGGQHFYYSVRLFGATSDQTLIVTFTAKSSVAPADGGGGSGAGGAGPSGGEGGGADEGERTVTSDIVFLTEGEDGCESGWVEIDNLRLQVEEQSASGIFRVELGSCDGACELNAEGAYVHTKVAAVSEIELTYRP